MTPYYSEDGVTIYHGDCREVMAHFWGDRVNGRPFDLLLTDPPYGIGIASNPVRQAHRPSNWDSATTPEALQMARRLAQFQIVFGGNYYDLPPSQCVLVWDKQQPEDFSLAMLEMARTNLSKPAKLYRHRVVGYEKLHPTQKPEELMLWCIRVVGQQVRSVFDPFMGSGTTLVAAKRLGKTAVGIEINEQYCEVAVKRLRQRALALEFPA